MLLKLASSFVKKTLVLNGMILGVFFLLGESLFLDSSLTAAEKVTFKRKLPAGKYLLEQDLLLSRAVSFDEKSVIDQQKVRLFWKMEVQGSAEGQKVFLKLDNVSFQSRVNSQRGLSFSSQDYGAAEGGLKKLYGHLQDFSASVTLDRKMNPTQIRGPKELLQALDSEEIKKDENCAVILPVIQSIFTPAMFSGFFEQMFYLLPEKSVTVGESWENETNVEIPGQKSQKILWKAKLENTKNVAGDQVAEIKGTGMIQIDENTETKCELETQYDLNTGLPFSISARSVISQTGSVKIQDEEKETKTVILFRRTINISPW